MDEEVIASVNNDLDQAPDNRKFQALVDHCMKLYKEFKESPYRKAKIAEIEESHRVYEQKAEKATFPWKDAANYIMPFTTISVDNLEPRLVAGLTGTDPIVAFDQSASPKKDPVITRIQDDFNRELKDVCMVEDLARNTVHTILLEGTAYPVPKYDKEKRKVIDFKYDPQTQKDANGADVPVLDEKGNVQSSGRISINENGEAITEEQETTVFEGGKFDFVPFKDILCADDVGTPEAWEKEPVIRIVRPTYAELMGKVGKLGYVNIGKWLLGEKAAASQTTENEQQTPGQKLDDAGITGKETIESIEVHLSYPLPLDSEEEPESDKRESFEEDKIIVTIALKSEIMYRLVLQRQINFSNEKMIKRVRLFPEIDRSFGTCLYGKIKSLQNGGSELFNQIVNDSTIRMIPWYFYDENSGLKDKNEIFPGAGVPVESIEGIKFPTFAGDPTRLITVFESVVTFWERLTSIADPQIGRLADKKETATGILTAVQEGNIKHNYQANTFKEEFLSVLKTMYDLYYKNMPYDKTIEFEGQTILYPRQFMRRQVKFRLTGSTEKANKLLSRKEAEDVQMMYNNDPIIDQIKIRTDVLKQYGKDDPKEYLNPEVNQLIAIFTAFPQLKQKVMQMGKQMQMEAELSGGKPRQPQKSGVVAQ